MAKKNVTEGTFKYDCKVINLKAEYPGYTGDAKYAIISDLTEDEIISRYPDDVKRFVPFVLLSCEMGKVIREYNRNEEKFAKRSARNESVFITCSEEEEATIRTLSVDDEQSLLDAESDAEDAKQRIINICRTALDELTPLQRDYLIRHYLYGIPMRTIAIEDGKSGNAVWWICQAARKKFIKACSLKGVAA